MTGEAATPRLAAVLRLRGARTVLVVPVVVALLAPAAPAASLEVPAAARGDGEAEPVPPEPPDDPGRGAEDEGVPRDRVRFRIFGLDFGSGPDPDEDDVEEPLVQQDIEEPLDLELRGRVRTRSLGLRARSRQLGWVPSLSASYRVFVDVIGGVLDRTGVRDERPDDQGGFGLGVSAALNEYWGPTLGYEERRRVKRRDDARSFGRAASLGAGWSPLGTNPGEPWNYALLAGLSYQTRAEIEDGIRDERQGFGYSLGAAYRYALRAVPIPIVGDYLAGDRVVRPDRFRASFGLADSEISNFSLRASLDVSAFFTGRVRLSTGVRGVYVPARRDLDVGFNVSLQVRL